MDTNKNYSDEATMDVAPNSEWITALTFQNGPMAGSSVEITGASFTIGRAKGNGLVIDNHAASRRHAAIEKKDGRYFIYDLGSRWGIKLNGVDTKEAELKAGDEIELAETRLRFGMVLKSSLTEKKEGSGWIRPLIYFLLAVAIIGTGLLAYFKFQVKRELEHPGGDVLSKIIYHYDLGIKYYNNSEKEKAIEEMKTVIDLDKNGDTQFSRSARRIIDGLEE